MIRRATVLLTAMVSAIVVAGGMGLSQTAPITPTYIIKELGTLPGSFLSTAYGINDSGQVVGYSGTFCGGENGDEGGDGYAFLYSNGQMQDLGTLPNYQSSEALSINDSGQVVGNSYNICSNFRPSDLRAFLYTDGQMKDLGTLPNYSNSSARGINDSGQVVGYSYTTDSTGTAGRAFLYSNGQMKNLGTLGGTLSAALGINDSGQVVGNSYTSTGAGHAFLYSGGQMQDLGTLGGTSSSAYGINDSGQVVGAADTSTGAWHAYLYSGGQMKDLGTLPNYNYSIARGINDSGQIVGNSYTNLASLAFLYTGGQMHNLNNLIPADSGWLLRGAWGINTSGQIVGEGVLNGQRRAFLATPTTSPPDTTPPKVISTVPKANADEVAPTANVRAAFSEEMRRNTINGTTFTLYKKGTTTQIAATVSYNADTDTAKLDPTNNLRRGVAYKAVVTTWAKDLAENRLDQDGSTSSLQQKRWFFRVDD